MKIYVILYQELNDGKIRYSGEIYQQGYKTIEEAENEVEKMEEEDSKRGWEYRYYISPVSIDD